MGVGGYRVLARDTKALSCADVRLGDRAEIDGRNTYREGEVLERGADLQNPEYHGAHFPCMIISDVEVASGG